MYLNVCAKSLNIGGCLFSIMRGLIFFSLALILLCSVYAVDPLCSDTDKGGAKSSEKESLKTRGEVKYGLTTQTDTCLTGEEGVSASTGNWLKEYYCSSDQRMSTEYDCVKLGYSKCDAGACVGGSSGANASNTSTTTTSAPVVACGNDITEKAKGEECDPPNSICFGKSSAEYGTCQADCKCKIAAAAMKEIESKPAVCGDGYLHSTEQCEEDANCEANHVCSSCKCVKQLTAEEIEAMKKGSTVKDEESEISKEIDEKYQLPETSDVEITAENFSEAPGMKATSGVANFFKKLFGWIAGLFS